MKVHIIGGTGQMGGWLKSFLESQKIEVSVSGSRGVSQKILQAAEIVFISGPISRVPEVIEKISREVSSETLLVDLSSVQESNANVLKELSYSSCAIHLLFGPTVSSIQNQKIILSRIKNNSKIDQLKDIFINAGGLVFEMTPEKHDIQMAHIQNLTHFINLSLAKILLENKVSISGEISTPVFLAQLAALNRVIAQNPLLLTEIQLGNKESLKVLEQFINFQTGIVNLIKQNNEPGLKNWIADIHQQIESSKNIKEPVIADDQTGNPLQINDRVSFLGPKGTFSHLAAIQVSKDESKIVECESIAQVFENVFENKSEFGIVPAENSTEGTIRETLDYLIDFGLYVNSSVELKIHQNLMSNAGSLKQIKQVISHPQAIAQSRNWLRDNLPNAKIQAANSTISAMSELKSDETKAAIGSAAAAILYDLNVLAKNIEDNKENITKFYIISKILNPLNKSKKTLIFLSVFNRVGVLKDILEVFASLDINLSKIESRPSKEKLWDYYFFIEVEVQINHPKLEEALNILRQYCPVIKILGSV